MKILIHILWKCIVLCNHAFNREFSLQRVKKMLGKYRPYINKYLFIWFYLLFCQTTLKSKFSCRLFHTYSRLYLYVYQYILQIIRTCIWKTYCGRICALKRWNYKACNTWDYQYILVSQGLSCWY